MKITKTELKNMIKECIMESLKENNSRKNFRSWRYADSHPTLAELAKNKYQCMFGNMEWCEFVYEPETKTLIQYYYDPDDQFDYHVETEADLDIALDQALGGDSGTWEITK